MPKRTPRAAAPPARPTPLPKRPKGRWFVGVFILAVFAGAAYLIWNTWFRFEVYGVVSGRIIHISPAVGGVIKSLHVREGTTVHQGELLATLENLQLEQQAAALGDALRIAQANLEAEITLHRAQVQQKNDQGQKAQADYVSLWGELLAKRSKIDSLRAQLQRAKKLVLQGAASVEEMERLQFEHAGETAKCEKLESAVKELKKRAELYQDADSELQRRCKPQLVRIETLQDELTRLRERLQESELRSSVNGRVVRISRFAGEYAETGQDILEILEDDSLEIILYVPQNNLDRWHKGSEVSVCVEPHAEMVPCVVERFADELEAAPPSIRRYYRRGEPLVPVYLSPRNTISDDAPLRLGSEVRLPYAW
ncbi:MAG: HlyD family efflux transporter periplasmic adaptor subunit [Pirellulales bacterium]|nr:HlyD family efflux transporter periplasmic adaptor subunit [Pirellulales bacterium]